MLVLQLQKAAIENLKQLKLKGQLRQRLKTIELEVLKGVEESV